MTIRGVIGEVKDKSIRFTHEMHNDETGRIAARATSIAVHLDALARKSIAFEAHVLQAACAVLASAGPA